ncbi:cation-transporting P-type ATPase [Gemmata obscuriglobus]|uniref:P-type ATPase n=1 Tax=Gemmata obscuriglobus TaxID=114 RepID=UPI00138973A3|nr:cation-transporting P-type ATPase [Gemmata obscuriglobus]
MRFRLQRALMGPAGCQSPWQCYKKSSTFPPAERPARVALAHRLLTKGLGMDLPPPDGLTTAEARSRLDAHGPNEVAPAARSGGPRQLAATVLNPLTLILLVAGTVAAAAGDFATAAVIAVVVTVSAAIQFVQTLRSDQAVRRLQDRVAVTATVKRAGAWAELPRRDVVPGDLIRLGAGDLVPADARLVEARHLNLQQAALTGESLPTEKEVGATGADPSGPAALDRTDLVFFGTSVVSGTGTAVVTATGRGGADHCRGRPKASSPAAKAGKTDPKFAPPTRSPGTESRSTSAAGPRTGTASSRSPRGPSNRRAGSPPRTKPA